MARVLGAAGRTLIAGGILVLLFVAYQLWGTGLYENRAQDRLERDFEALLEDQPPARPAVSTDPEVSTTTTVGPPPPPPNDGDAAARIRIPKIGVDKIVVEGVSLSDLKRGPGHYPDTPLPGQPGNAAIAGHRTTYGAPFYDLDDLVAGDVILVTTLQGRFRYEVFASEIVRPTRLDVLDPTPGNQLTLTTCNPRFSASQRLIVRARLTHEPAPAPPPSPSSVDTPEAEEEEAPGRRPAVDPAGLGGEGASNWPAILWGLFAAAIWLGTWLLARHHPRRRRWLTYAAGTPVFLVVLFMFFENFSRLLPANF